MGSIPVQMQWSSEHQCASKSNPGPSVQCYNALAYKPPWQPVSFKCFTSAKSENASFVERKQLFILFYLNDGVDFNSAKT